MYGRPPIDRRAWTRYGPSIPLRAISVPANAIRTVWVPSVKKYRSYAHAIGYTEGMGERDPPGRSAIGRGAPYPHDPLGGGLGLDRSAEMSQVPACGIATCASTTSQDRKSTRLNSSHVAISYAV